MPHHLAERGADSTDEILIRDLANLRWTPSVEGREQARREWFARRNPCRTLRWIIFCGPESP